LGRSWSSEDEGTERACPGERREERAAALVALSRSAARRSYDGRASSVLVTRF
jgi:hypothetical protein